MENHESENQDFAGDSEEHELVASEIDQTNYAELSAFKRDLLVVIGGMDSARGTEIMGELEQYYDDSINHGRLYPNLDELVEQGFVDKFSIDGRSNGYRLTEKAQFQLILRRRWQETLLSEDGGPTKNLTDQIPDGTNSDDADNSSSPRSAASRNTSGKGQDESGKEQNESDIVSDLMGDFDDLAGSKETDGN
ncbi:PadR family transcriptional regulator [Halobacterium sp. KA-4]|uniref:PadR family transcriptional regulator n=1 Tax=Halobacterium sp. KA-4 TaxID=2896367 RepID=UPI001E54F236|nr:PadR family transcriptional regulator [Halobacterium sp. KA-4]MCD2200166.1 PadR family transcriptional regulator [Halobacterium sp. KA-4]